MTFIHVDQEKKEIRADGAGVRVCVCVGGGGVGGGGGGLVPECHVIVAFLWVHTEMTDGGINLRYHLSNQEG